MEKYKVLFLPEGVEVNVAQGNTIMKAAALAGVELEGPCGGKGTCGKCRVRLIEEKGSHWTLACQTLVTQDMRVEIPQADISLQRKGELERERLPIAIEPVVQKKFITVEAPTLENQSSDLSRLQKALGDQVIPSLNALKALPRVLEKSQGKVTAVLSNHRLLAVEAGNTANQLFGIAVDIGTTTVVVSLMNLVTGEILGTASATNTQNSFGADVISRIEHVMFQTNGLDQLQRRVVNVINRLIKHLCRSTQIEEINIYQAALVGNTTMSHLFLGIDPRALAPSPYTPVFTQRTVVDADEVGLKIQPQGIVTVLPSIAGYVGGDTVGVILATGLEQTKGVILAIDIGTNGEMVLAVNGRLTACSTAAGPAFEGAHIKFGMRAAAGAIEGAKINHQDLELKVIGGTPVKGICGSGLLEIVQQLLKVGIVTPSGKLISQEEGRNLDLAPALLERLGRSENGNYFYLAPSLEAGGEPIVITQRDVRELQLAKAAIRTGIDTLLREENLTAEDIDQVLLAGAFGSFINKLSALDIGMIPPVNPDKIMAVGNAAGKGARMALISQEILERAVETAGKVKHIELSGRADFQEFFIDRLNFVIEDTNDYK